MGQIQHHITELYRILPERFRDRVNLQESTEIRMRVRQPLIVETNTKEYVYTDCIIQKEDIQECLQYASEYSIYAFQENIRQGFLTIQGGHRIGVCGQVIIQNQKIQLQQNISFLNIRVAHEIIGCADEVMSFLYEGGLAHTLILSPPGCGKTTILRDIIVHLSNGWGGHAGKRVAVVDERSEIAACHQGVPQNQMGIRTDVIDNCPKAEGIRLLVRAMNPEIIAVDEIGTAQDAEAIVYSIRTGCVMIGTVHAESVAQAQENPMLHHLISPSLFSKCIVLDDTKEKGHVQYCVDLKHKNRTENI